jgi:phenylpropionate dioxygenase-like ring-hydroxylating dioxygenase large terminal subunit
MRISTLTDDFFESLSSSAVGVDSAETLPPACYTDPQFFAFEKEVIFRREWLCVGRESWLKSPGDYFTTQHAGEPILVTRTLGGELNAMSAVCQHRAMFVAEGRGHARSFMCPYHHWTYGLDGRLLSAPAMERACNFRSEDIRLPQFKVETWLGFLFINMDPNATPLTPRLAALTEALERHEVAGAEALPQAEPVRYAWNWKVMIENNNDGYHANRLHKGPLHDFVPSALASFPDLPPDSGGYFRYNGSLHSDVGFNPTTKALFQIFPRLTPEDRQRVLFMIVPPSLSVIALSDMIMFSIVHAESHDSIQQQRGMMFMPGVINEPLFRERLDMFASATAAITAQDRHVDSLVQAGLQSRYAIRGRYSWQEGAQSALNRWLVPRYQAAWRQTGNA